MKSPQYAAALVGAFFFGPTLGLGALSLPSVEAAQRKAASPVPAQVLQIQPQSHFPPPQPPPADGERMDYALDRDSVRRVIYVHIKQIRHCYQLALMKQPALQGRVILTFDITPQGQVEELGIRETSLQSSELLSCVCDSLRTWEFPRAPFAGGNVRIIYPFAFRPKIPDPPVGIQVSDDELAQLGIFKDPEPPSVEVLF
jgi:hypothetical protein